MKPRKNRKVLSVRICRRRRCGRRFKPHNGKQRYCSTRCKWICWSTYHRRHTRIKVGSP